MITSWDIYWITRLDSIEMFCGIMIAALVSLVFAFVIIGSLNEANPFHFKKSIIACVIAFFAFCFISLFTPSTKEACAIYLIPKIANNEQVQKIPDNALKLLNTKMEEWIDDTLKKKESK